ncbi:mRNA turnover protein 4 [Nematocida homosporus]|uniref:mRNA turnover protein 4 n=1 Tax=Nematocida homosporus TaxID=1912981 RepID=UPI00222105AB|nr:mRNA turnover protein 4 [Nematocida homosporus]KAI5184947.1 mRNA turnover protein 4 [Nematocida homosporus]
MVIKFQQNLHSMDQKINKRAKVDNALSNVTNYKNIYKILCDNKTAFIQQLKRNFRNNKSEMIFGKYRMVEKVLGRILSAEDLVSLRGENPYKKSDRIYLYVMSDLPLEKIAEIANSVDFSDYERKGAQFEEDIIIPAGELLNRESIRVSNTLFKDIKALGLVNAIINPKTNNIEVTEETVLGRKGEDITEAQEKMIRLLGIKNRTHKAEVTGFARVPQE